jgi:hypothetical protein
VNAQQLWSLSPEAFNQWRRENDYPVIFSAFEKDLPFLKGWMDQESISKELMFEHGIARFIDEEDRLVLLTYAHDGKSSLFEKGLSNIETLRLFDAISASVEYMSYFQWLKNN